MDARKIRALLLVAVAAASAAAARQDAPPPPADDSAAQLTSRETLRAVLDSAPARTRVGGMRGARVASRVVFDSAPQRPHELLLSAAFPARTRVELVSADGRVERYQLGRALFGRESTLWLSLPTRDKPRGDGGGESPGNPCTVSWSLGMSE